MIDNVLQNIYNVVEQFKHTFKSYNLKKWAEKY